MNNEENDIERQELARRVGKNGDRILMEYFDDIGLANKTNNEINDLINRLRICGVDIKKVFSAYFACQTYTCDRLFHCCVAGIVFKSYTVTFYSVIALFVSSVVTDKIITFGDDAKMLQVFSAETEKISNCILNEYERGVTGVHCRGMYSNEERLMLLCVITPKELPVYMNMIKETDKNAFIIICDVHKVIGEGFKSIY